MTRSPPKGIAESFMNKALHIPFQLAPLCMEDSGLGNIPILQLHRSSPLSLQLSLKIILAEMLLVDLIEAFFKLSRKVLPKLDQ